jgi:hypothetical protein
MAQATDTPVDQQFTMPTPTSAHERLKPFEGTFRAEVKLWMGPGEPIISTGTMVNSFVLDGLYLAQDYTGDASDGPFPSFRGKGFWGYNTTLEQYEGFWIDSASTMMQLETGTVDAAGRSWTMQSEVMCSQSRQMMSKRTVIKLIDQNHHQMVTYFKMDGAAEESKMMEINYRRA